MACHPLLPGIHNDLLKPVPSADNHRVLASRSTPKPGCLAGQCNSLSEPFEHHCAIYDFCQATLSRKYVG